MTGNTSLATLLFAIVALAMVLAIAWLVLKGLNSLGQRGTLKTALRVKATLPLGSRERLLVVGYKGMDYLIGVSSGSVSLIDKHSTEEKAAPDDPSSPPKHT